MTGYYTVQPYVRDPAGSLRPAAGGLGTDDLGQALRRVDTLWSTGRLSGVTVVCTVAGSPAEQLVEARGLVPAFAH